MSRARCNMPQLHIQYLKNCGNLTQDAAYCSEHIICSSENFNFECQVVEKINLKLKIAQSAKVQSLFSFYVTVVRCKLSYAYVTHKTTHQTKSTFL